MNHVMSAIVSTISGVSIIAGIVLSLRAVWLGTVREPRFRSDEPMIGIPFWKMKSYFTPKAYRTYVAGTVLIILGSLLLIFKYLMM